MYHLPKDVRVGFDSKKLSSKHQIFHTKLPNISNDNKISNDLLMRKNPTLKSLDDLFLCVRCNK